MQVEVAEALPQEVSLYREKPVTILASEPLSPDNMESIAAWCDGQIRTGSIGADRTWLAIATSGGPRTAFAGDRICLGPTGYHVIKGSAFDEKYELVEDG